MAGTQLNEDQTRILEEFKALLNDLDDNRKTDDNLLIQFLEANVWNKEEAKNQLRKTIKWRKKFNVDKIPVATLQNKLPLLIACRGYKYIQDGNFAARPEISESMIRIANCMGGGCFHKFDKNGHPILIDRTGYHNTKEMGYNVKTDEVSNFQIFVNEFLNRVILPEGSERVGRPIHSETIIFDCTNMSLWQLHMSAFSHLRAIAEIVQNYYPETLHRLFVVNAPSAFVVMFKIIKPCLNARTLEKIHVLGSDFRSVLLEYIDPENLPDFLGGTCQCQHMPGGCVPSISKEKFVPTNQNERVLTPYNTNIMKAAISDKSLSIV
ncbi:CRAL-TRIO domain-containing protein [Choanephora cucurbitarum]|nr:CRAL-TRIO domain-containing protein [Choanephora cucurbitarum]